MRFQTWCEVARLRLLSRKNLKEAQRSLCHLFPLLGRASQGVQVSVGEQLRLHGADSFLQAAQLAGDLPLQLLHLLQVLLQALGLWGGGRLSVRKKKKKGVILLCACACVSPTGRQPPGRALGLDHLRLLADQHLLHVLQLAGRYPVHVAQALHFLIKHKHT